MCYFQPTKNNEYDRQFQNHLPAFKLHISETRRCKYLQMLVHAGYITGIQFRQNLAGGIDIIADNPLITIQGLEYLSENSIMQRIYKTVKGIADVIT